MHLERLFPKAGWFAVSAGVVALVVAGRHPPLLGGVAWLGAACLLGPWQPPPPDRTGATLTATAPTVTLPPGNGGIYLLDLALANSSPLPTGTPVAELWTQEEGYVLHAGEDTAEWAHQRADVQASIAHALPRRVVWRPHGEGRDALWGVVGRVELEIPPGVAPVLRLAPELPPEVALAISTAGPSQPTPPRSWALPAWLGACAMVVAFLQLLAGTWRHPVAAVPWVFLAATAALARAPVEPLRLLLERHGVDLCLAALLAAWLPAARRWLGRRRVFVAAATLLVPVAAAAAHLHPGGGDEHYHLIVLRSLAQDGDLDLSNNYELERYPGNRMYVSPLWLHSPLLAILLAPGFVLGGRAGALVLLALGGATLLAVVARLGASLRLPPSRIGGAVLLALGSFPLATFSSQMWTEIPGALAAAASAALMLRPLGWPWLAAAVVAILATSLKTRLGLLSFAPVAAGLTALAGLRRRLLLALPLLALAVLAALAAANAFYGHPLGPIRRFHHLLPTNLRQPTISFLGLLFDCAGGFLFAAPLWLAALGGLPRLWRLGKAPIRGLFLGALATVFFLLPSHEWYGGGSPPVRYLVPALPVLALALAVLLATPSPLRRAVALAVPPGVLVWCTFLSRPHLAFNPGDGGWWLGDALARRFAADTRALFPSFLVPTPATMWVPMVVVAAATAWLLLGRRPAVLRTLARLVVPLWLVAAAGLVGTLAWRTDRVVELEAAQVVRLGGAPEPPEGTFSRFLYRNGWRLGAGDGVQVPLRLPRGAQVELMAKGWDLVEASWQGGERVIVLLFSSNFQRFPMPPPPGAGRQLLQLRTLGEGPVEVVLDRVEVRQP